MISRSSVIGAFPTKPLGEVVEFLDSMRRPVTESDRRAGPYPYYGANGQQGTIDDFIFDEPLVLLAEDGGHFYDPSRGIAYRVWGKTWVNNHAHVLRPNAEMDLGFLCRVLENYDVTPWVTGTTRGKLTQAGAAQVVVPVPPLPEQRRIAAILDKADELRAKRRAALAKLDTLTQSIFLDMFGDPATNPKRWNLTSLGEISEVQGGLQLSSSRKSLPREVPYLRVANVYRGLLDLREIKTLCATESEIARTVLFKDDFLVVEGHGNSEEIGRGALWDGSISECVHQNHLIRVRFDNRRIMPLYASVYLNSTGGRRHLLRSGKTTSGLNTINVSQVRSAPIAVPPVDFQRQFCRQVGSVECLRTSHTAALVKLTSLLGSLQHHAFRGEL